MGGQRKARRVARRRHAWCDAAGRLARCFAAGSSTAAADTIGASQMKKVAVLGGGPGGSFAAERLARAGLDTIIIDEKLAWEKPCGGGLTYKAYNEYPFLIQNDTPKKFVSETTLSAPRAGAVKLA